MAIFSIGALYEEDVTDHLYRSIILAKGGDYWIYEFLFAKQDRSSITDEESSVLRKIAKNYAALTFEQIDRAVETEEWMEICHGSEEQI